MRPYLKETMRNANWPLYFLALNTFWGYYSFFLSINNIFLETDLWTEIIVKILSVKMYYYYKYFYTIGDTVKHSFQRREKLDENDWILCLAERPLTRLLDDNSLCYRHPHLNMLTFQAGTPRWSIVTDVPWREVMKIITAVHTIAKECRVYLPLPLLFSLLWPVKVGREKDKNISAFFFSFL